MTAPRVDDDTFRAVYQAENGSIKRMEKILHMSRQRMQREYIDRLGLKPVEYITLREAAKRAGVPHSTLARWIERGELQAVRHHNYGARRNKNWYLIRPGALEEFLDRYPELRFQWREPEPGHLLVSQVADTTGYCTSRIIRWLNDGTLTGHKNKHGVWQIPADDPFLGRVMNPNYNQLNTKSVFRKKQKIMSGWYR